MNKIDISNWKEHNITDLFDFVSIVGDLQAQKQVEGNIPLVSSGTTNNGICMYIEVPVEKSEIISGNKITVDMFGKVFYQPNDFYSVAHARVNVLKPKFSMNKNIGLFLATIIEAKTIRKYSFGEMCSQTALSKETIMLPTTEDGEPDWQYMEAYINSISPSIEKHISKLDLIDDSKNNINTTEWKYFPCIELFNCKNTGNILARDVLDGSGNTPYVTASGFNNGVVAYIDASKYEIIKGNCILIGGKTFTITYQENDFVSNDSHNFTVRIKEKELNKYHYKYLATIITSYFGQKYSWSDAVTKPKFLEESIPLPVTKDGEPDWQYMEAYIKNIEKEIKSKISKLESII